MPIDPIYLQQRLAPLGRIRAGKQVPTSGGKTKPVGLERFRLTTPYRWAAEAVAARYGGTVEPWENDLTNDRWQVETDTDALDVVVLPAVIAGETAVSQWFEQWGRGGCTHRCTGSTAYMAAGYAYPQGIPCDGQNGTCGPDARDRLRDEMAEGVPEKDRTTACKVTSRLSVLLPDVAGTGQWRIDTGSWNAATELGGVSDWLVRATAAGYSIKATLSLVRTKRRRMVNGKAQTHSFIMPTLIPQISPDAVKEIEAGGAYRPELDGISITPIEPRRPLQLDPGHPDTPPPRRPGGRHRTVDTVVAPPALPPSTAAEAATLEAAELEAQAVRGGHEAWLKALPPTKDAVIADLFALCAQRWGATWGNVPQVIRDRVARGAEQIASGELKLVSTDAELQLIKIPSGDVALSLAIGEGAEA